MAREVLKEDIEKVKRLCSEILGNEFTEIRRLGGNTNHTYHVSLGNGNEYVVRIPGEGTEELIVRKNERVSTELANKLNIDARLLYFGGDGSKITEYIPGAITMEADGLRKETHMIQMTEILRKLHTCGEDTGVPFEVFSVLIFRDTSILTPVTIGCSFIVIACGILAAADFRDFCGKVKSR